MQKLSFDSVFYSIISLYCFWVFNQEYWFPQVTGGEGSCSQIFKDYPNWPKDKRTTIEGYFCFQLGVHGFSLFELFAVRRKKERKFYEWTLHHIMASTLILFSLLCNAITIGTMILFVHDVSDVFLSTGRFISEANLPSFFRAKTTLIVIFTSVVITWVYFRLSVYPICLVKNVYENIPTSIDSWFPIYWEYTFLFFMCVMLVFMHAYWLGYLVTTGLAFARKK